MDISEINGATLLYAILGDPVEQVSTPGLINRIFSEREQNKVLITLHVKAKSLEEVVSSLKVSNASIQVVQKNKRFNPYTMQYPAKTPPEYLEQLESDWRKEKLQEVRQMILRLGPELQETIEYKMLAYKMNDQTVFHLNAQRAYVSLYVGDLSKIEGADELLQAFDKGKGCIRIRKSEPIHNSGLEAFIIKTLDHWKKGGDTLC